MVCGANGLAPRALRYGRHGSDDMKKSAVAIALAVTLLPFGATFADQALGTWLTEPDRKAQTAHVGVTRCGPALCGTILRAYDKAGRQITTPNVGKRIFWDTVPTSAGQYQGRAFVPMLGREYPAQMQIKGNRMVVKGCLGPACMSQNWTRVN